MSRGDPAGLSANQLELIRKKAQAAIEGRVRAGAWQGAIRAHTDYATRPLDWIVKYLHVPRETIVWSMDPAYADHKWDGDVDPLAKALQALADGDDVGIESATGVGKTFLAACVVLWFLACFEDAIIVTAAPKEDQLLQHLWKEIGKMWPHFQEQFPHADLLTGKLRMRPEDNNKEVWSATAFVCGIGANEESATKAQGFHATHMLIITEETPGVHTAIMHAFQNTRTDDHNLHLALGNPEHRHDTLHQFCADEWVVDIRISAFDHPNIVTGRPVIPGAIGARRLERRIQRYKKGSRLYQSRVRGISPAEAEDALIRWEWCEMAAKKYEDERYREGVLALGVDVANSEEGDRAAISTWQGACCIEVIDFACPDANALGARVAKLIEDPNAPIDPRHVGVDVVGVGAGTVNELKRLGHKVRHISSARRAVPGVDTDTLWSVTEESPEGRAKPKGETVIEAELFDNLRSQVFWRLREDLRQGRIALPDDEELFRDLTAPTFDTPNGVIRVQKKDEIKAAIGRSPNKGDACAYGNWVRRRRPVLPELNDRYPSDDARDYGLEKLLDRREKVRVQEERQFHRLLGGAYRAEARRQR